MFILCAGGPPDGETAEEDPADGPPVRPHPRHPGPGGGLGLGEQRLRIQSNSDCLGPGELHLRIQSWWPWGTVSELSVTTLRRGLIDCGPRDWLGQLYLIRQL